MSHQVDLEVDGRKITILADILPVTGPMRMLLVAKTPAPTSVAAGHYFQGRQGRVLWNRLRDYGIFEPPTAFEDDSLVGAGLGITDIAKEPREFGTEPSSDEYMQGAKRILSLVARLRPEVVMFVYKRVLDKILRFEFDKREKSSYGFNPDLDRLFGARVFAFPMPGTPCTSEQAALAMAELGQVLRGAR